MGDAVSASDLSTYSLVVPVTNSILVGNICPSNINYYKHIDHHNCGSTSMLNTLAKTFISHKDIYNKSNFNQVMVTNSKDTMKTAVGITINKFLVFVLILCCFIINGIIFNLPGHVHAYRTNNHLLLSQGKTDPSPVYSNSSSPNLELIPDVLNLKAKKSKPLDFQFLVKTGI